MVEIRQLKHFVAVAEELHFARAAERLGMEQSPLSHSIRNLEDELKTKLFHRTTRQTWLTQAGTRFYADAKRILNDVDFSTASLHEGSQDKPEHIRLALAEDLAGEAFTRMLFELEHHRPPARVDVRELSYSEAAKLVRDGGADVALTLDSRAPEGLMQVRAWAEPLMLVVPIGHRFAERDAVDLGEIGTERLALPRPTICPGYLAQVETLLKHHETDFANRVNVRHWNTAVSFASAGRALALVPASFANGTTSVAVVSLEQDDAELVTWILHRGEPSSAVSVVLEIAALIGADPDSAGLGGGS